VRRSAAAEQQAGRGQPRQRGLQFLEDAPIFERMLVNSGIRLFKYYLDIDRSEQVRRLKERRHDPLSQ
jgi:polyphosphate kinase